MFRYMFFESDCYSLRRIWGFGPVLGRVKGLDNLPHEAVMFRYNVGQGGVKAILLKAVS